MRTTPPGLSQQSRHNIELGELPEDWYASIGSRFRPVFLADAKTVVGDLLKPFYHACQMKRPFQVTMLGWLFIVVGVLSTTYHLSKSPLDRWTVPILLVGTTAIVAGFFLLRGAGWAR